MAEQARSHTVDTRAGSEALIDPGVLQELDAALQAQAGHTPQEVLGWVAHDMHTLPQIPMQPLGFVPPPFASLM